VVIEELVKNQHQENVELLQGVDLMQEHNSNNNRHKLLKGEGNKYHKN